jgi:glycosyltransferase involved in cell wall biosynthesis
LKVVVAQKGAREHYAVAQVLHQRGMLAGLVTDWYARPAFKWLAGHLGGRVRAAAAARCEAIPDSLVRTFSLRGIAWKWRVRKLAAEGRMYEAHAQTDAAFGHATAALNLPPHDVFFGYSYASLEMLEAEKARGVFTVLDQIDPGAVEHRLVAEEMARHPEIAGSELEFPATSFERNRREWALADLIIVNSEWSRDAIIREGAPADKIEIIPLCYEQKSDAGRAPTETQLPGQPLRVLFLGQVNVRKGIRYLIEAARQLSGRAVEFVVAGPTDLRPETVKQAPPNMRWLGPIPRGQATAIYRQSDVFVLPTLSDGFALTQLEAMANGLPVIATPNCGRVVNDGRNGFIVPAADAPALAEAILKFVTEPGLAQTMRPHCLATAREFSLERFGQTLIDAILKHRNGASVAAAGQTEPLAG